MPNYGDTPYQVEGVQEDYRVLFYNDEEGAIQIPITLAPGYGLLKLGMAIAENVSAGGNVGMYVPYNPLVFTGAEDHPGRAYLVATNAAAATFNVTIADSYKFIVGDDIIINDDNTSAEDAGAITAIDRTTYSNFAVITVGSGVSGTFAPANFAYIAIEAGSSNNYSDCKGILIKAVETGTGAKAKGAQAQILISNAMVYTAVLFNMDATAKTAIAMTDYAKFSLLR